MSNENKKHFEGHELYAENEAMRDEIERLTFALEEAKRMTDVTLWWVRYGMEMQKKLIELNAYASAADIQKDLWEKCEFDSEADYSAIKRVLSIGIDIGNTA